MSYPNFVQPGCPLPENKQVISLGLTSPGVFMVFVFTNMQRQTCHHLPVEVKSFWSL
jgi:hypothetical protein